MRIQTWHKRWRKGDIRYPALPSRSFQPCRFASPDDTANFEKKNSSESWHEPWKQHPIIKMPAHPIIHIRKVVSFIAVRFLHLRGPFRLIYISFSPLCWHYPLHGPYPNWMAYLKKGVNGVGFLEDLGRSSNRLVYSYPRICILIRGQFQFTRFIWRGLILVPGLGGNGVADLSGPWARRCFDREAEDSIFRIMFGEVNKLAGWFILDAVAWGYTTLCFELRFAVRIYNFQLSTWEPLSVSETNGTYVVTELRQKS